MSKSKRTRHTASFLLSHYLNSKESFELTWLTGSLVSILRYMYDVMEMTHTQTNLCVCNKSINQIADYARTGRETVKRALPLFVKNQLLSVEKKKPRAPTHYGIGNLISTRLTMSLELSTDDSTRLTTSLELGSLRAQETPNWAHGEPHVIKSCKKDSKKKRESAVRAPLSEDFAPDKRTREFIKSLAFEPGMADKIGDHFFEHFLDSGEPRKDWQFECRKWFRRERKIIDEKPARLTKTPAPQPQPTRDTRSPSELEPKKYTDPAQAKEFMKGILSKLNGKGGHAHGILDSNGGDEKTH